MSTNHTTNYDLCQWEATDQVLRTDFNEDNARIDAALESLKTAISLRGNCKVLYGSYKGNNKFGSLNPTSLTFSSQPLLVIIFDTGFGGYMFLPYGAENTFMHYFDNAGIQDIHVAWSDKTVSWWGNNTLSQANDAARNYRYIALVAIDA